VGLAIRDGPGEKELPTRGVSVDQAANHVPDRADEVPLVDEERSGIGSDQCWVGSDHDAGGFVVQFALSDTPLRCGGGLPDTFWPIEQESSQMGHELVEFVVHDPSLVATHETDGARHASEHNHFRSVRTTVYAVATLRFPLARGRCIEADVFARAPSGQQVPPPTRIGCRTSAATPATVGHISLGFIQ